MNARPTGDAGEIRRRMDRVEARLNALAQALADARSDLSEIADHLSRACPGTPLPPGLERALLRWENEGGALVEYAPSDEPPV